MPSLFEPAVREQCIARLAKLTPDTRAKWGQFTAAAMVAHLNDSFRMAIGDLPVAPKPGPFRIPILRWLVIHVMPFPKGAPTAPELLARFKNNPVDLDTERLAFKDLFGRLAARQGASTWSEHPLFGSMTERDWGVLGAKHIDHHFRQFGI